MAVSAGLVKELREKTGAGMLDCKKALEEANGDITKASEILREKVYPLQLKKPDALRQKAWLNLTYMPEAGSGFLLK
jgi:translation elongation factor EF-Ts